MVPLSIILVSLSIHPAQLSLCMPRDINGHIRLGTLCFTDLREIFLAEKI